MEQPGALNGDMNANRIHQRPSANFTLPRFDPARLPPQTEKPETKWSDKPEERTQMNNARKNWMIQEARRYGPMYSVVCAKI